MVRELSNKLGLQIIIVTQLEELAENADKVFKVTHNGEHSLIKEIGE